MASKQKNVLTQVKRQTFGTKPDRLTDKMSMYWHCVSTLAHLTSGHVFK